MKIEKPTLLLDTLRARNNIHRMAEISHTHSVRFRPHFKTHQSIEIGEWFREENGRQITVSSVDMAMYFAGAGWSDILIAFPVNILQIRQINELAGMVHLGLLVESMETLEFLKENLTYGVDIWIKVDVGAHRTGISWDQTDSIEELAHAISQSPRMVFRGLLTHAGHTYTARSKDEIRRISNDAIDKISSARNNLQEKGLAPVEISIGDTPGCTLEVGLDRVDEIRPGNFVLYDLMQLQIGSCTQADIAAVVACPVVARHIDRNELVLYGGAIHLSKEYITLENGRHSYGAICPLTSSGWGAIESGVWVKSLSQEHGIVRGPKEFIQQVNVGDVLAVVPVHSCLTVNLMKRYQTLTGETILTLEAGEW